MQKLNTESTKNLKVVIGLGKTGISCIKYLLQQGFGVAVIDNRVNPPGLDELHVLQKQHPEILLHLGSFTADFLAKADELIVSPGVSLKQQEIAALIAQGIPAIGDIELFARAARAPIVAITGSNGKSTVTTLVGLMAEKAGLNVKVGGNLGTPVLELLDEAAELYVLELSSFQLETTYSLNATAAVVLNTTPDHMDRYKDFAEYVSAKQRIYNKCKVAIINRDDAVSFHGVILPKQTFSFGLTKPEIGNFGYYNEYLYYGEQKLLAADAMKTKGMHQVANALAALALGTAINLPQHAMLAVLAEFPGLPHRCQYVATINQVDWYNDSKGTNVGATSAAIDGIGAAIKGKIVLIAGGDGKGADFTVLCSVVAKYVRTIVLIGKDAQVIESALKKCCKIMQAKTMEDAVFISANEAKAGDVVLLSPACSSLDMFENFEQRGNVFMQLVKNLSEI